MQTNAIIAQIADIEGILDYMRAAERYRRYFRKFPYEEQRIVFVRNMILIPAGRLEIGSVDAFYIDARPVTNLEYQQFLLKNQQWQKPYIEDKFHDGDYLKDWEGNDYPSGESEPTRKMGKLVFGNGICTMGRKEAANRDRVGICDARRVCQSEISDLGMVS